MNYKCRALVSCEGNSTGGHIQLWGKKNNRLTLHIDGCAFPSEAASVVSLWTGICKHVSLCVATHSFLSDYCSVMWVGWCACMCVCACVCANGSTKRVFALLSLPPARAPSPSSSPCCHAQALSLWHKVGWQHQRAMWCSSTLWRARIKLFKTEKRPVKGERERIRGGEWVWKCKSVSVRGRDGEQKELQTKTSCLPCGDLISVLEGYFKLYAGQYFCKKFNKRWVWREQCEKEEDGKNCIHFAQAD